MADAIVRIAEAAGREILEEYARAEPAAVTWKEDASPLTVADRRSHEVIAAALAALAPGVPVVSEEGEAPPPVHGATRWLVDPLDGTKEFLKRSGEFTVNIALVESGTPVLGVVHAPATGVTWVGGDGAAHRLEGRARQPIRTARVEAPGALRVVASRDHAGPGVRALLARLPGARLVSAGSSLKFCLLAEGNADLYYRDGPTMAWDTAAAHAVLRAAGGEVLSLDGAPLRCDADVLRNPPFVAVGDRSLDWSALVAP